MGVLEPLSCLREALDEFRSSIPGLRCRERFVSEEDRGRSAEGVFSRLERLCGELEERALVMSSIVK